MRTLRTCMILGCSVAFTASCGSPGGQRATTGTSARAEARPTAVAAQAPAHRARPARAFAPAPPRTTTPMSGEPAPEKLAEARLEPTTCDAISDAEVAAQLAAMRTALRVSYKRWHDAQPACWAEDRARAAQRAEETGGPWARSFPSGAGHGYASRSGDAAPAPSASATLAPPPRAFAAKASTGAADDAPARAAHTSHTNNQVASVDEADIVKTDGTYVYVAARGALRIVTALDPKLVSVTRIPGTVRELFVEDGRAVVYSSVGGTPRPCTYGYDCSFAGDGTQTTITVLDVANAATPTTVRSVALSGSLLSARRIGKTVHTVVADGDGAPPAWSSWPAALAMCGTPEAKVRARFAQLEAENVRAILAGRGLGRPVIEDLGAKRPICGDVLRAAIDDGRARTTLVSFDLDADRSPAHTVSLASRPGAVFASRDALYVAVAHRGSSFAHRTGAPEVTELHKIALGARAKDTRYVASGTIPGHVLGQLAMDEWHDYLRVAASVGRVPDPNVSSEVSILVDDGKGHLVRVGAAQGIAPGEDIRAVRFDDDRGYVVTFKKTDPLFVLDLARPTAPTVLGELEIPGFSTYLHRLDRDHLLTIGFDADDHGSFAYFDGLVLQLFDVSSPTEPRLLHKEKIGTRGSSSEAATNHLAFNYDDETGLLAVPMTVCEGGGDGRNGSLLAFSGLYVYDVDLERGFTRLGGIDHGTHGANCGTWWSNATSLVKRSVFVDDLVWSIADDRAKVQRLGKLGVDVADFRWDESARGG